MAFPQLQSMPQLVTNMGQQGNANPAKRITMAVRLSLVQKLLMDVSSELMQEDPSNNKYHQIQNDIMAFIKKINLHKSKLDEGIAPDVLQQMTQQMLAKMAGVQPPVHPQQQIIPPQIQGIPPMQAMMPQAGGGG